MGQAEKLSIPKRGISKGIFRYMLWDFLIAFGASVICLMTFFLVLALIDDLNDFTKAGAPVGEIISFYFHKQTEHLVHAIPVSLLLGALYSLSNMTKNNEMVALRAMGVSVPQASAPFILVGVIMIFFMYFISENLVPYSKSRIQEIQNSVRKDQQRRESMMTFLAYRNKIERRDWLFKDLNDGAFSDVYIKQFREDRSPEWDLSAEKALYNTTTKQWIFQNLTQNFYHPDGSNSKPTIKVDKLALMLPENPKAILYHLRLNAMDSLSLKNIRRMINTPEMRLSDKRKAILNTQFYYRLLMPLSCLIAVMLATPLAFTTQRTGAMLRLVTAVIILISYYLIRDVFLTLGNNQILPPLIAGCLPAVAYLAWGFFELFRKG